MTNQEEGLVHLVAGVGSRVNGSPAVSVCGSLGKATTKLADVTCAACHESDLYKQMVRDEAREYKAFNGLNCVELVVDESEGLTVESIKALQDTLSEPVDHGSPIHGLESMIVSTKLILQMAEKIEKLNAEVKKWDRVTDIQGRSITRLQQNNAHLTVRNRDLENSLKHIFNYIDDWDCESQLSRIQSIAEDGLKPVCRGEIEENEIVISEGIYKEAEYE